MILTLHRWFVAVGCAVLIACTPTGAFVKPETVQQQIATSVLAVAAARDTAGTLASTGKITRADAENIQKQADLAREGIQIADSIARSNPTAGQERLVMVQRILTELNAYLLKKQTEVK